MIVERIKKLDINNRPLFTGIYGHSYGQEYFVEDNLCKYSFWQELYRYLRNEGYTTLFYNNDFGFFSYEESQLETFFFKKPDEISNNSTPIRNSSRFIAPIASPNGQNRRRGLRMSPGHNNPSGQQGPSSRPESSQTNLGSQNGILQSHRPNAILVKKTVGDSFFQMNREEGILRQFFDFMDKNPDHRLAIIFTEPSRIHFPPEMENSWLARLQADYNQQKVSNSHHRLIVCYDVKTASALSDSFIRENGFFFNKWFQDQLFPNYSDNQIDLSKPSNALFKVEGWGKDEVGNVLKRRRITDGLRYTLGPTPFDDICLRIWQQFCYKDPKDNKEKYIDSVQDMMDIPIETLESQLLKMDNEKAMDKLRKLHGIDNVIEQFERYLADLRASRESGDKFRRHMVFLGNPGTGKTTVARLFADVLREEGLLENGRLHAITVADLVSQYVSNTRIKAQEVCQSAHGGVLFLDEAYGLYQSGSVDHGGEPSGNQHGKEAVEVLLQFMENDDNSLVIMAGYPDEMEDMLKNSNNGFESRIGPQGRFHFKDYTPEILLNIALSKIDVQGFTDKFRKSLLAIFVSLWRFKDKTWANARTAENTIGLIKSTYRSKKMSGPFDVDSIPDDLMRLIKIPTPDEESQLMSDLDSLLGLETVKNSLKKLFENAKIIRRRLLDYGDTEQEMPDLNFFFMGNPGTGKTTVARLLGKILAGYGLLKSPDVKEYKKDDIISPVLGGSVKNINRIFDECIGKVLFIDEAYSLADSSCKDVVDQIVQNLTHPKYCGKMAVIMAGYPEDMKSLEEINQGMQSRFKQHIVFDDYSNEQLAQIYINFAEQKRFTLADGCRNKITAWFKSIRRGHGFGNARLIDTLHTHVNSSMANRLANNGQATDIYLILPDDIPSTLNRSHRSDEEILASLNNLVGLRSIKEALKGIIEDVKAKERRAQFCENFEAKTGLNFVFIGNPGTGKTTVASLLGEILVNYGLISSSEVVVCTKKQLVDGTVGGGARNMEKIMEKAVGKVLFIDEAYQLASTDSKDVLDTLTNLLTNDRYKDQLAIILAGYPGDMAELINSNPGLQSRFTKKIFFEDYSNDELTEIFRRKLLAERFIIDEVSLTYARAFFSSLRRNKQFGNARETEKLFDIVKAKQGERTNTITNATKDDIFTILPEDFPNYGKINIKKYLPNDGPAQTAMDRLKNMKGLDSVRQKFEMYIKKAHFRIDNPDMPISNTFRPHMAFLGNPGTGKTTVARLFGEILREEGLLTNNNFIEVGPDDLIGQYVGQSAPKAREQFERSRGGILFIDEAYELYKKGKDGGANQFGEEVITALLKFMEDERDTVVIMAGYTDEIRYLLNNGNTGLKERVTNEFIFEDYDPNALFDIFVSKMEGCTFTDDFKTNMRQIIRFEYDNRDKRWGNARTMENYANEIFGNHLMLNNAEGPIDSNCIPEHLMNALLQDLHQQVAKSSINNNSAKAINQASLTIDLTTNPGERRVTDSTMLKEHATGLLKSTSGEGTGFIISIPSRLILTCSHVIEGAGNTITFSMNCNREFDTEAHVLWSNYEQDMALLQLDSLPEDACYIQLDNDIENPPQELTELVLCGYPDGSAYASTPSLIPGSINNYEKQHAWNDRCFDTIYANVSATHGCSGGPVVRKKDMVLVGILQGGKEGGEIQFITDIHQLFNQITIKS